MYVIKSIDFFKILWTINRTRTVHLFLFSKQILTTTTVNNVLADAISERNKTDRLAKSILAKMFYPKTKTQSTVNHHTTGVHNSFGVAGNVGIGFHFGGGYRIKNGDGKDEQQIVHHKIYDKYMGTSFGFGSLGNIKNGHVKDVEQSISADQQVILHDDSTLEDEQQSDNEATTTTTTITETSKPGVFRKISSYWAGEPKSDYASNGILKWSVQKFKNKNNLGTPR